ncbi:MAG: hypothetical protein IPM75_15120 [Candidatus Competibacteraceae bacterium]|nr:hypothetical protein [Candidatus Competibacteraceae bacterium]
MMLQARPPVSIDLVSAIGYRVRSGAEHEDLMSLALRFEPTSQPLPDALGLAGHSATLPDEGALSVRALERIARRIDADNLLAGDGDLNERMIETTEQLLKLARVTT